MEKWEIKERTYQLKNMSPLTYKIRSSRMLWFDEDKGVNREIRYASNQKSLFVEDQDKYAQLDHVVFENGMLTVPRNNPMLQQLLSIYHPDKHMWEELDAVQEAKDDIDMIEQEIEAQRLVQEL